MNGPDRETDLDRIAEAGFDGVEAYWDGSEASLPGQIRKRNLVWVAQIHTRRQWQNGGAARLRSMLASAVEGGAGWINLHTGVDLLSVEAQLALFDLAEELAGRHGVPVCHETHRGRVLSTGPRTAALLTQRPSTRFCTDLSHWCCAHESLLADQEAVVNRVLAQTDIVHARAGYAQGPQVPDWRMPAFQTEVETHFGWWDRAVAQAREENRPLVLCPEFGPPPYQPLHPSTGDVLGDLWEINLSLSRALRKRYGA